MSTNQDVIAIWAAFSLIVAVFAGAVTGVMAAVAFGLMLLSKPSVRESTYWGLTLVALSIAFGSFFAFCVGGAYGAAKLVLRVF